MKKLLIVLLILIVLAIAISISPITEFVYSLYAEEMPTDSTALLTTTPITSLASNEGDAPAINTQAITFAMILSTGTILVSLVILVRKHKAES